jgi:hypothetical protein
MARFSIAFGETTMRSGPVRMRAEVFDARGIRIWRGSMPLQGDQEVELPGHPAGTYVVRAELPSGEWLDAQVEVPEGESGRAVLWPEEPSPWESMDWAYYIKGITRTGRTSPPDKIGAFAPATRSLSTSLKADLWAHRGTDGWESITEADRRALGEMVRPQDPHLLAGFQTMLGPGLFCLQVARGGIASKFVVLPPANPGDELRIAVVLDRIPPDPADPYQVIVNGADSEAEAMVGYLTRSELTSARAIGDDYLHKTEGRRGRENAAVVDVVAGYYLLLTTQAQGTPGWVESLAERFPWLPDGPALHAGFLLRGDLQGPALDRARALLMEAERRGPPCFTLGLRLLFNGFETIRGFEELRDLSFDTARRRVAARASAADGRAPNTTFLGDHPDMPRAFIPAREPVE